MAGVSASPVVSLQSVLRDTFNAMSPSETEAEVARHLRNAVIDFTTKCGQFMPMAHINGCVYAFINSNKKQTIPTVITFPHWWVNLQGVSIVMVDADSVPIDLMSLLFAMAEKQYTPVLMYTRTNASWQQTADEKALNMKTAQVGPFQHEAETRLIYDFCMLIAGRNGTDAQQLLHSRGCSVRMRPYFIKKVFVFSNDNVVVTFVHTFNMCDTSGTKLTHYFLYDTKSTAPFK